MIEFEHHQTIRWCETDLTGTVHFANYVRYMEETEYAFLRSIGLSVILSDSRGSLGFPRLKAQLDVKRPARFGERILIRLRLQSNDGKQLCYEFSLSVEEEEIVVGRFDIAFCRFPVDSAPYAVLIPDWVLDKLPLT